MPLFFEDRTSFFVVLEDFCLNLFRNDLAFFFDFFNRCNDTAKIYRCFANGFDGFVLCIDFFRYTFDSFLIGFHNRCFCDRFNLYLGWLFAKQTKETFLFTRYNRNMRLHTGNI